VAWRQEKAPAVKLRLGGALGGEARAGHGDREPTVQKLGDLLPLAFGEGTVGVERYMHQNPVSISRADLVN
jgi:hypothetical protein